MWAFSTRLMSTSCWSTCRRCASRILAMLCNCTASICRCTAVAASAALRVSAAEAKTIRTLITTSDDTLATTSPDQCTDWTSDTQRQLHLRRVARLPDDRRIPANDRIVGELPHGSALAVMLIGLPVLISEGSGLFRRSLGAAVRPGTTWREVADGPTHWLATAFHSLPRLLVVHERLAVLTIAVGHLGVQDCQPHPLR